MNVKANIVIVGDGPHSKELKAKCEKENIENETSLVKIRKTACKKQKAGCMPAFFPSY